MILILEEKIGGLLSAYSHMQIQAQQKIKIKYTKWQWFIVYNI